MNYRIGIGYDVHRFIEGRNLIIGGVLIPYNLGLDGHSDADVLTHAIIDSLLGAMGKGDIGTNFPDDDETFKNISSLTLLNEVFKTLINNNYLIINIDCTIIAQEPKISPYIEEIKNKYQKVLKTENINIKATTEEGLGFTGELKGMKAQSIVMIKKIM